MSKSSSCPRHEGAERRVALLARVKLAGATLSVACTHLHHRGGGAREQLAAVIETLIGRPSPASARGRLQHRARRRRTAPRGPRLHAGAVRPDVPGARAASAHRLDRRRRRAAGRRCPAGTSRSSGITARSVPTWPWSRPPEPTYRFGVPYATRPMHDADSHIMEEPDWLHPYLDAATRERFPYVWSVGDEPGRQAIEKERARHAELRVPRRGRVAAHAAQELLRDRARS